MPSPNAPYRPPFLLRDLQLLDALELTGSTGAAGRWLRVSQPTVSRHCRRLRADFGLGSQRRGRTEGACGDSASLRLLRLAARWHRFEAGVAAVGADPLHEGLLAGVEGIVPQPCRFRPASRWRWLIREALLDAALVSSLELEHTAGRDPGATEGGDSVAALCLGTWPLELATVDPAWRGTQLLVPPRSLAPELNALLRGLGLGLQTMETALVADPLVWPERLAAADLALALPKRTGASGADPFSPLQRRPTDLRQRLWLLLPEGWWQLPPLLRLRGRLRGLLREEISGTERTSVSGGGDGER